MEFFIDTANINDIIELNNMGLVDGVTTNPTLIKKAGKDHENTIREIADVIAGPISVETLSTDAKGMLEEAKTYQTWGKNIVIKIVMTAEGMKAVKELSKQGVKTNVTVTFSPLQALVAAKAGASYISPFVGRLDDISHRGLDLIEDIRQIFDNYAFDTKILVASIRSPLHILDSGLIGADVITAPPTVLKQLFNHPLTDKGVETFIKDSKAWATS